MIDSIKKINYLLTRKSKIHFSILLILLLIKSLLDGFGIGLIAPYIAFIRNPQILADYSFVERIFIFFNISSNVDIIVLLSIILIFFFIIKNFFTVFVIYFESKTIYTNRSILGTKLYKLYMRAPYAYHLDHNTAEFDRNMRFESPRVYSFIQSIFQLVSNILLTLSISIVLIIANWKVVLILGLVLFLICSLFLFFTVKYNKKYGQEVQDSQLYIGQSMKEGLSSVVEAKVHSIEDFFPNRYYQYMMRNARAIWKQATLGAVPNLFFEILAVTTISGMIVVLTFQNIDINNTLPVLALFSFAFIRLIPSVTAIVKSFQQIKYQIPSVDIIFSDFYNISKLNAKHKVNQNQVKKIDFSTLELKNISFNFKKSGRQILSNINLKVDNGESIGITGPSGSGKSTLINLILGLLKPVSGKITLNGNDISFNNKNWRSLIGYVPQTISLIDSTIKENICLGLEMNKIDEQKVWKVLNEANIDSFVNDLPKKLDTIIGENGMRLSGGQRQRLGLARTLYNNPEVLVFDEATSSLDIETEKKITKEIMQLSGMRTLIIVAHRISTIQNCDRIYYLKDGKIIDSGNFVELTKSNKDFNKLAYKVK